VFLIIAYFYSAMELEKCAEQALPGSKGGAGERVRAGGRKEK
jgi:hypothetical protein